jgi:hypothetical protein
MLPVSKLPKVENVFHQVRCTIAAKPPSDLTSTSSVAAEDVKATARAEAVAVVGMKNDAAVIVPVVPLW